MQTERMTAQQFRSLSNHHGRGKYNTAPKPERTWSGMFHGYMQTIVFHSKMEMLRFCELRVLEISGVISWLEIQPKFCIGLGQKYVGDFYYRYYDGTLVCEDVKGHETQTFKLKWPRVQELYPKIEFRLVKK